MELNLINLADGGRQYIEARCGYLGCGGLPGR